LHIIAAGLQTGSLGAAFLILTAALFTTRRRPYTVVVYLCFLQAVLATVLGCCSPRQRRESREE